MLLTIGEASNFSRLLAMRRQANTGLSSKCREGGGETANLGNVFPPDTPRIYSLDVSVRSVTTVIGIATGGWTTL